jgi:hypothetical protein
MTKTITALFVMIAVNISAYPLAQTNTQAKFANLDIGGAWELTLQRNNDTADLVIVQDGNDLKVTFTILKMATLTGTGTIKGDAAEWSASISTLLRTLTWKFNGKVEGDKMSGDLQMSRGGTSKWTAVRKRVRLH